MRSQIRDFFFEVHEVIGNRWRIWESRVAEIEFLLRCRSWIKETSCGDSATYELRSQVLEDERLHALINLRWLRRKEVLALRISNMEIEQERIPASLIITAVRDMRNQLLELEGSGVALRSLIIPLRILFKTNEI